MKKLSLLLLPVLLVAFTGCGDDPAAIDGDAVTRMATLAVQKSVDTAWYETTPMSPSRVKGTSPDPTLDWTSPDGKIHVHGSYSDDGAGTVIYNLTVDFTSYTYSDDDGSLTMTGSTTYTGTVAPTTWTLNYDGILDIVFNGEAHDYAWDVDLIMTFNDPTYNYVYTGSYTIDGTTSNYSFSWNYSPAP